MNNIQKRKLKTTALTALLIGATLSKTLGKHEKSEFVVVVEKFSP